jgi:hypothetical protein
MGRIPKADARTRTGDPFITSEVHVRLRGGRMLVFPGKRTDCKRLAWRLGTEAGGGGASIGLPARRTPGD